MTHQPDRPAPTPAHEIDRAGLMARYGLSLSTLTRWYHDRAQTGHPEAIDPHARVLTWNAQDWDIWHTHRTDTTGLATRADLALLVDRSVEILQRLWEDRQNNQHPEVRKQLGRTLYWNQQEYLDWFHHHLTSSDLSGLTGVDFSGNGEDLITLTEAGRILGMPNGVSRYPKRPPVGWPEPAQFEQLPGGRISRRRYRRADIWDYAKNYNRRPGGGRPPGATNNNRRYLYDGDPRLQLARTALASTPTEDHPTLPKRLATEHGSTPGTWANILTTARQHPHD